MGLWRKREDNPDFELRSKSKPVDASSTSSSRTDHTSSENNPFYLLGDRAEKFKRKEVVRSYKGYSEDTFEETLDYNGSKLVQETNINENTALKLQRWVLVLSWTSVIFSLVTGVIGIVLSLSGNSEALFAYGLDAILDSMSSIAVLWRFHGPNLFSSERERRACLVVGAAFLISASSLIARSVWSIVVKAHESKEIKLYEIFAGICACCGIILGTAKVILGIKLSSPALTNDSIITYVGAVSCIAGVAGLEIYVNNSEYWYLDSVFGMVLGAFLLFFGIRLLISNVKLSEKLDDDTSMKTPH